MGEAYEGRRRGISGMENLFDKYPRDLLQRFMAGSNRPQKEEQDDDEEEEGTEEIELNLGLSLGGRFGVDKNSNKLIRSTSVASSIALIREDDDAANLPPVSYPTLIRTSSLPTETEEEWRKRKELQTLNRMAAKRRRSEKQKSSNPSKTEKEGGGGGCAEEERREIDGSIGLNLRENQYMMAAAAAAAAAAASNRFGASAVVPSFGLPGWAPAARQALLGGGIDTAAKGKGSFVGGGGGLQGFGQPNSQGSVESQGGSSSGMSDFESKPVQGSSSGGEARSPASNQSLQEPSNQETMGSSGTKSSENTCRTLGAVENPSKRPDLTESRGREAGMSAMEDMPCVFTKGDGPNGRRIDGILYKYGKGEEVRIMCVCHGTFLSPAEFVKHAGGGDVAHPLRHIVVNPSANSFL